MLTDSRALMHLSVCGGGIIQSASELGISRRAQTLLKDALECFDADGLRVSYREWKPLHTELQRLEASVEYSQQMSKANAAALVYHECARQVDRTQMVRTRYGEREEGGREGGREVVGYHECAQRGEGMQIKDALVVVCHAGSCARSSLYAV